MALSAPLRSAGLRGNASFLFPTHNKLQELVDGINAYRKVKGEESKTADAHRQGE
jgi:hypothetical protein